MNFLYSGCITRRSTSTVTVLSILSLVTRPVRTRLGIALLLSGLFRRGARCAVGLHGGRLLLRHDRLHTRDVAPNLPHPSHALGLPAGALETQVELLLAQIEQHRAELVRGLQPHIGGLGLLGHLTRLRCG